VPNTTSVFQLFWDFFSELVQFIVLLFLSSFQIRQRKTHIFFAFGENLNENIFVVWQKKTNMANIKQYDCWKGVSEMTSDVK